MADDDGWFEALGDSEPVPAKVTSTAPSNRFPPEVGTRPGVGKPLAFAKTAELPQTKKIDFPKRESPEPAPKETARGAGDTLVIEPESKPAPPAAEERAGGVREAQATRKKSVEPKRSSPEKPSEPGKEPAASWPKLVVYAAGAMVGSYFLVSLVTGQFGGAEVASKGEQSQMPNEGLAQQAATQPAPAQSVLPPTAEKPESEEKPGATAIEVLPIPQGMVLGKDKGVLKVITGGAHSIYVDGEFAGRGPVRIVPVNPGSHEVKMRLSGVETSLKADVQQGKLTLLKVEGESK
jgi:hypothetical protein